MHKCFAPFCRTGLKPRKNEVREKVSLFSVPKDKKLFNAWKRAVPRNGLNQNSKICEKHFLPDEVLTRITPYKDVEYSVELGRKRLAEGAIPSQWPGCPSYLSKQAKEAKKRKPPKEREPPPVPPKKQNKIASCEETIIIVPMDPSDEPSEDLVGPFGEVGQAADNIQFTQLNLPPGWVEWLDVKGNRPSCDTRVFFKVILVDEPIPMVWKSVTVNNRTKTFTRSLMSKIFKHPNNPTTVSDVAEIEELIKLYDQQEVCVKGMGCIK